MSAEPIKPAYCKSCQWTESELRRRVVAGGAVQIVYQCLNCGRSASNPLPRASVRNPNSLPGWDDKIAERYDQARAEKRLSDREEWFRQHDAYLATPEWRAKRRLVMERCKGICEGCGNAQAVHVHHLTYDHWQKEFLWELAGVCFECHERAHKQVRFVGVPL